MLRAIITWKVAINTDIVTTADPQDNVINNEAKTCLFIDMAKAHDADLNVSKLNFKK